MLGAFKEAFKENGAIRVITISVLVCLIFAVFNFSIYNGKVDFGFGFPVYVTEWTVSLRNALFGSVSSKFEFLAAWTPLAIFYLAHVVVSPLLLLFSVFMPNRSARKKCVLVSLLTWVICYFFYNFILSTLGGDSAYVPALFLMVIAVALFALCLFVIKEMRWAAWLVCGALIAVAFVMLALSLMPFGYSFSGKTWYLSVLARYAAYWVACAAAVAFSQSSYEVCDRSLLPRVLRKKKEEAPIEQSVILDASINEPNFLDSAEEIKQLKMLCDEGAITQEEFNRKKHEILGV